MIDLPASSKKILDKVCIGELSKAKAARKLGVSRKTIYEWTERYCKREEKPVLRALKLSLLPKAGPSLERELLHIIVANPEIGPKKIAEELKIQGKAASVRTVWLRLKKLQLGTTKDRREYAYHFKIPQKTEIIKLPKQLRLTAEARKRMVEEVVLGDKKVASVTTELKTSRKTFAKWVKRYQFAKDNNENLLAALNDAHPVGVDHPRGPTQSVIDTVLSTVAAHPSLSAGKIAQQLGIIGNHGVQRILERAHLSKYEARLTFSKSAIPEPILPTVAPAEGMARSVWKEFTPNVAPAPPPGASILSTPKIVLPLILLSGLLVFVFVAWVRMVFGSSGISESIGLIFASIALFFGTFFFLYSLKYYITTAIVLSFSQQGGDIGSPEGESRKKGVVSWFLGISGGRGVHKVGHQGPVGLQPNLDNVHLQRHPMVSIQIPLYNERFVAERAITAAINLDYPEFEVIVADDSTDATVDIIREFQKKLGKVTMLTGDGFTLTEVTVRKGVVLKHLHRTSRSGYKGGALKLALQYTNPRVEFVSIFDADFVPYPDSMQLFLKYFKVQNNLSEDYSKSNVAVVQGYQWHVLNKSENWITRGVRTEYAGSYVVERAGTELYGGLKMISGSVYMIRRDVLNEIGWGTSITEDFELTLRLYEKGYKVVYTPYIQAPAECVSTLKRLIRQRMRWSEGHSVNTKLMFKKLLQSNRLTMAEKSEFLYLSPYYLQAFFFLVGTFSWLLAEVVFQSRLPFWTALWGWSLVLTNLIALPLVNIVGLFLEESEEKDYLGILSFLALCYIVVPFQAYAAVKGFLEKDEGTWFRTPKTGRVTDTITRGKFYRLVSGIFGGRQAAKPAPVLNLSSGHAVSPYPSLGGVRAAYLALATANNRFNTFKIRPQRLRWIGKTALVSLLIITTTLLYLSRDIQTAQAANYGQWLQLTSTNAGSGVPAWGNVLDNSRTYGSNTNHLRMGNLWGNASQNNYFWFTNLLPTGNDSTNARIQPGNYYVQFAKQGNGTIGGTNTSTYAIQLLLTSNNGTARTQLAANTFVMQQNNTSNVMRQFFIGNIVGNNITNAAKNRLAFHMYYTAGTTGCRTNAQCWFNIALNNTNNPARLFIANTGGIQVPEIPQVVAFVVIIIIMPAIPGILYDWRRHKKQNILRRVGLGWTDLFKSLTGSFTGSGEEELDELPV